MAKRAALTDAEIDALEITELVNKFVKLSEQYSELLAAHNRMIAEWKKDDRSER